MVTNLAAAAGVVAAVATMYIKSKKIDIGMAGNGAIAALVAITAPSGYVELWAAPIIGLVAGVIVVFGVLAIDKLIDDPVGALSAHGLAGIWGTLACGLFTSPRLAEKNAVGDAGLFYSGSFDQLFAQALGVAAAFAFVFSASFATFWLIKKTYGLRVTAEEEEAGLDIVEHGMYGYPEQFIPAPELIGYSAPSTHTRAPAAGRVRSGGDGVKKIEAFIRHEAFEPIRMELLELGFPSLTISEVKGSGRQKGVTERYRGASLTNYLRPKVKLECVVASADVETRDQHDPQARPDRLDRRRQGVRDAGRGGLPDPHGGVGRGDAPGAPGGGRRSGWVTRRPVMRAHDGAATAAPSSSADGEETLAQRLRGRPRAHGGGRAGRRRAGRGRRARRRGGGRAGRGRRAAAWTPPSCPRARAGPTSPRCAATSGSAAAGARCPSRPAWRPRRRSPRAARWSAACCCWTPAPARPRRRSSCRSPRWRR